MIQKIKPITIEIEKEVWYAWKNLIPRDVKLNDAVVYLIKADLYEKRE